MYLKVLSRAYNFIIKRIARSENIVWNKNTSRYKTGKTDISSLLSKRHFENAFWKVKMKYQFYQFYIYWYFHFIQCFRFWLFFLLYVFQVWSCFLFYVNSIFTSACLTTGSMVKNGTKMEVLGKNRMCSMILLLLQNIWLTWTIPAQKSTEFLSLPNSANSIINYIFYSQLYFHKSNNIFESYHIFQYFSYLYCNLSEWVKYIRNIR